MGKNAKKTNIRNRKREKRDKYIKENRTTIRKEESDKVNEDKAENIEKRNIGKQRIEGRTEEGRQMAKEEDEVKLRH